MSLAWMLVELARGARTIDILCVQYIGWLELGVLDRGFGCAALACPPPLVHSGMVSLLIGALVDDTNKVPADLGLGALNWHF